MKVPFTGLFGPRYSQFHRPGGNQWQPAFDSLKRNRKKIAGAILKMYHQQEQMFKEGSHTCANRIISVFQPHVRPIVRGKSKSPVEFGAKIGQALSRDTLSWAITAGTLIMNLLIYRLR